MIELKHSDGRTYRAANEVEAAQLVGTRGYKRVEKKQASAPKAQTPAAVTTTPATPTKE